MITPAGHLIHFLHWKQQKTIIISSCGNHFIIRTNFKATYLLIVGFVSEYLLVNPVIVYGYVSVSPSCYNQVICTRNGSYSSVMDVTKLFTLVCFVNIKYFNLTLRSSNSHLRIMFEKVDRTNIILRVFAFIYFFNFARTARPNIKAVL
jgi:hypothetical protein